MISHLTKQHNEYEARLKAQRDERARASFAVRQAVEQGRAEGRVMILREMLDLGPMDLDGLSMASLAEMESDLLAQM